MKWLFSALLIASVLTQRPQEGRLRVGDHAPDFNLRHVDSQKTFKLSSNFGARPTLLIFGSYT